VKAETNPVLTLKF